MKIGIDARMYSESGIGRYLRNLLIQLRMNDHNNYYIIYCLEKDYEAMRLVLANDRWKLVVVNFKWYTVAEQFKLPWILYRDNLDLVHFPHFNVPVFYLKRFIVTIHDLTHFTFSMKRASTHSQWLYFVKHAAYSLVFRFAVYRSKRILTVSKYVKKELLKKFGCRDNKVVVTYEAAEMPVKVTHDAEKRILRKLGVSGSYFLYVGNAHPHKNLEYLIKSFSEFKKFVPAVKLILVGRENYFWTKLLSWSKDKKINDDVVYLGYVSDSELSVLYSRAVGFVFPSLSEGFGLPVLEAMSYSCPVICSETTSLPEVVGDAAVYIDPHSEESLVRAFHMLYSSSDIRNEKIQQGLSQVKRFSWEEMGSLTLNLYTELIK